MDTICGVNCNECYYKNECKGCVCTQGKPFGGTCIVATCCQKRKFKKCSECNLKKCLCKEKLIKEVNDLHIPNMPIVTELYQLKGSLINLYYPLPNNSCYQFWNDNDIYLGTQLPKGDNEHCYGIAADNNYLLICEYGENGKDPKIIMFKKRCIE